MNEGENVLLKLAAHGCTQELKQMNSLCLQMDENLPRKSSNPLGYLVVCSSWESFGIMEPKLAIFFAFNIAIKTVIAARSAHKTMLTVKGGGGGGRVFC